MVTCWARSGEPSGVWRLPRARQLSPTRPSAQSRTASSSTRRRKLSGRQAMSSTVPSSRGERRMWSSPASRARRLRCSIAPSVCPGGETVPKRGGFRADERDFLLTPECGRYDGGVALDPAVRAALESVLASEPDNAAVRIHLASLLADDDPAAALEHASRVLTSHPDDPQGLAIAARTARAVGDEQRAAAYERLLSALTSSPTPPSRPATVPGA